MDSTTQRTAAGKDDHELEAGLLVLSQIKVIWRSFHINALEALSGVGDGPREVVVRSAPDAAPGVRVTVGDTEPGLDP